MCIALCLQPGCVDKPSDTPYSILLINVGVSDRQLVNDLAESFAASNGYVYSAVELGSRNPREIVIHMVRNDSQIIGRDPFTPGRFQFGVYRSRGIKSASDRELEDITLALNDAFSGAGSLNVERFR